MVSSGSSELLAYLPKGVFCRAKKEIKEFGGSSVILLWLDFWKLDADLSSSADFFHTQIMDEPSKYYWSYPSLFLFLYFLPQIHWGKDFLLLCL